MCRFVNMGTTLSKLMIKVYTGGESSGIKNTELVTFDDVILVVVMVT